MYLARRHEDQYEYKQRGDNNLPVQSSKGGKGEIDRKRTGYKNNIEAGPVSTSILVKGCARIWVSVLDTVDKYVVRTTDRRSGATTTTTATTIAIINCYHLT